MYHYSHDLEDMLLPDTQTLQEYFADDAAVHPAHIADEAQAWDALFMRLQHLHTRNYKH